MTEQWKSLDCFEGFNNYEVSNRGRLRSTMCSVGRGGLVPRSTPRLCKLQASSSGYLRYRLQRFGRIRSVAIHELVLHAFVGPRPEGMWAAHGNGDKSDNRVENLRWATHLENMQDQIKHGTTARGTRNGNGVLREAQVHAAWFLSDEGYSAARIARLFGVSDSAVLHVLNGDTWGWLEGPHELPEVGGVLLALLGHGASVNATGDSVTVWMRVDGVRVDGQGPTLGRACIAAAEALGRWPGGER